MEFMAPPLYRSASMMGGCSLNYSRGTTFTSSLLSRRTSVEKLEATPRIQKISTGSNRLRAPPELQTIHASDPVSGVAETDISDGGYL